MYQRPPKNSLSVKYVLRFMFSVIILAPAFFSLSSESLGDIKVLLNILRSFPKSVFTINQAYMSVCPFLYFLLTLCIQVYVLLF